MALLFMEGFDRSDYTAKWNTSSGSVQTSATRFGYGGYLSLGAAGGVTITKRVPAAANLILGFAFNAFGGVTYDNMCYLYGDLGATRHLVLRVDVAGSLSLRLGNGTLLGTAAIPSTGWAYIEISATINSTTGRVIVRVNGVVAIDYTGNTKSGGTNTTLDMIGFSGGYSGHGLDDLYVCDTTGTTNNAFLGDVRVQMLLPTGAGSSTQLTPTGSVNNYANVSEVPDNTATYNSGSTVGNRDTYVMTDLSAATGPIYGMQNSIVAWKTDAGIGAMKTAMKVGAGVYYDTTISLGTSASAYLSPIRETNPATSAAWTLADINSAELGAEVA